MQPEYQFQNDNGVIKRKGIVHRVGIILTIIGVVGAIGGVVLVSRYFFNGSSEEGQEELKDSEIMYTEEDYTPVLAIYAGLGEESVYEDLEDGLKEVNRDAVISLEGDNGTIRVPGSDAEYIKFKIRKDEDDEEDYSPYLAYDFTYVHQLSDGSNAYIMQSGENTFQHYNGQLTTSEFFHKIEAISDHLSFVY